jgi:hypothetical protein
MANMPNIIRVVKGMINPGHTVAQVRCVYDNMGDIFVYLAIDRLLNGINIFSFSRDVTRMQLLERMIGFHRIAQYSMLGGGTLIYSPRTVGWAGDFKYLLQRTNPLCTFGTGVIDPDFLEAVYNSDNEKSPLDKEMMEEWIDTLQLIPLVAVRGVESERILAASGFTKCEVIGDPTMIYAEKEIRPKLMRKNVGINILETSYFWPGSKVKALEEMQKLLVILVDRGWNVTLFPASHEDVVVARRICMQTGLGERVQIFPNFLNVEAYIAGVATMDVFVGMRLHSYIAACCSYTPAIMVGYQPKCHDITRTLGMERFYFRTDKVQAEEVLAHLAEMYESPETIQAELYEKCQHMKEKLINFAARVKEYMMASQA